MNKLSGFLGLKPVLSNVEQEHLAEVARRAEEVVSLDNSLAAMNRAIEAGPPGENRNLFAKIKRVFIRTSTDHEDPQKEIIRQFSLKYCLPSSIFEAITTLGIENKNLKYFISNLSGTTNGVENFTIVEELISAGRYYKSGKETASILTLIGLEINNKNFSQSTKLITHILDFGGDINAKNNHQETIAHYAAALESPELLVFLTENTDIDLEAKDQLQRTPLFYAVRGGRKSNIAYLLTDKSVTREGKKVSVPKVIIDVEDSSNETPLHAIILNECELDNALSKQIFEMFVEYGADLTRKSKENNILHLIADAGRGDLLEYIPQVRLKAMIEEQDHRYLTPLYHAAKHEQFVTMTQLINRGADIFTVDSLGESILFSLMNSPTFSEQSLTSLINHLKEQKVDLKKLLNVKNIADQTVVESFLSANEKKPLSSEHMEKLKVLQGLMDEQNAEQSSVVGLLLKLFW